MSSVCAVTVSAEGCNLRGLVSFKSCVSPDIFTEVSMFPCCAKYLKYLDIILFFGHEP